ncbi:MAG: lysostaphin resistance A-like protein, partial [Terriglobia bacterium]
PLGEETLVRGYLYSGLRKYWRFWPALLFTSLLFGAAHLEFGAGGPLVWAAAIDTFLLSVVLCYLRERTGALYAGILVHMLNNLIAFGVHFK